MELINFHNPILLIILGVFALVGFACLIYAKWIYNKTQKYNKFKHLQKFRLKPIRHNYLYWAITVLVLLLSGLMISRPVYDKEETLAKLANTDIYFLVDISNSMGVNDMNYKGATKTRLESVKNYLRDYISASSGSRYSLTTFSHVANVELPLTTDINSIISSLDTVESIPSYYAKGSYLSVGLTQIANNISKSVDQQLARQKILVVFSDGEQTGSDAPQSAGLAEIYNTLRDKNVAVVVVGVGSTVGGKVPYDATKEKSGFIYYNGGYVISKLEEGNLKKLSDSTNGKYVIMQSYSGNDSIATAITSVSNAIASTNSGHEVTFKDLYFYLAPIILILLLVMNRLKLNSLERLQ